MTVDNVILQTNNVLGNFNYPPNVPAYKRIMKFLQNCSLYNAFTNCLLVVYQNFLKEFWSTVVAFDLFPLTDEPEKCPLKEFLIKFLVLNGQRPLTLDFNNFSSSTGTNYNNGKYVDHPKPKAIKKELGKITIKPSYLDKTLVLKNSFPVAQRILFTFVIQYLRKMSKVLFNRITKKQWEQHEEAVVSYADLKAFIEEYYKENIAHRDKTDQLVASSISSLDKSSSSINDLYKGLNVIIELLKDINNSVKVDLATNKKIDEATKTFAKISTQTTKILSLVKTFDFYTL
nr:hypothetical protein [Tanacetum cinerariifolium]